MRKVERNHPTIEADGPLFHVATLRDVIPDGPNGLYVNLALLDKNPVLRARERRGFRFRFVVFHPFPGNVPSVGSFDVPIELYADALPTSDSVSSLIDDAMSKGAATIESTALA